MHIYYPNRFLIGIMFTALASSLSMASAQDINPEALKAQLSERLVETRKRLELTDEQVEQLKPILQAGFETQAEVLEKHGIDINDRSGRLNQLGIRELRSLRQDLDKVRSQTLEELDGLLTETQIKEYKAIVEERKQMMRERLRQRRN